MGFMIFRGRYRHNQGAWRPFITGHILSSRGGWVRYSFLVDTGADETFLHYQSVKILGIDTSNVDIKDDVGGIGGHGIPYFQVETKVRLVSSEGDYRIFGGGINIFLDASASRVPILGRDILDHFVAIFDREHNDILLMSKPDGYRIRN